MKKSKKKNIIYSTNPDYNFEYEDDREDETLENKYQELRVYPDRKNRKGKTVTVVTGFVGKNDDLKELEKRLKALCGCGGTAKDGDILLQGNFIDKVADQLKKEGFKVKISGI